MAWVIQVGQPVVRVARGKLQLGVVLDTRASSLLVAVCSSIAHCARHHCRQVPSQVGPLGTLLSSADPVHLIPSTDGSAHVHLL